MGKYTGFLGEYIFQENSHVMELYLISRGEGDRIRI